MKKFAIDFVILPPDPVMDMALSLNRRLCDHSIIVLDKRTCSPHISLLMGCLRLDQLDQANRILLSVGAQFKSINLKIENPRTVSTPSGNVIALDIEPNDQLRALHQSLFKAISPLMSTATADDVAGGLAPGSSALDWINHFITHSSLDNFWPHITIGYAKPGETLQQIEPLSFDASRLAICHLGDYCTCREVLNETSLDT